MQCSNISSKTATKTLEGKKKDEEIIIYFLYLPCLQWTGVKFNIVRYYEEWSEWHQICN